MAGVAPIAIITITIIIIIIIIIAALDACALKALARNATEQQLGRRDDSCSLCFPTICFHQFIGCVCVCVCVKSLKPDID